jgi:uncharacterized membrane protein
MRYICHQHPDRCFSVNGKPMKLCARCTGFYPGLVIGTFMSVLIPILYSLSSLAIFILTCILLAPMAVDGISQYIGRRESNNILRFITGILAGAGTGMLLGWVIADIMIK